MRWSWFFTFFIISIAGAYGASRWLGESYTPRMDEQARQIRQVGLVDGHGNPASFESFAGRPGVVLFGYMSCPDVCPTSLAYLRNELDRLGADRHLIQAVFVSVDPERDTPERLGQYVGNFGPGISGWTGTPTALREFTRAFGAYFDLGPKDVESGSYTVSHSSSFYILDGAGRLVATLPPPHEDGALAELMMKAIRN